MKLIRELRWGPPKSFKTGAIVGTYPKPMLVFQFDQEGVSVLPSKTNPPAKEKIQLDSYAEDIVQCAPGKLGEWVKKPVEAQPRVLVVDYTSVRPKSLSLDYAPAASAVALNAFQKYAPGQADNGDFNQLANLPTLPWKTVVWDGVTGYMEVVLSHFASVNPNRMADARDWAFQVGQMVKRVMTAMTLLPCHSITLMHDEQEKNENTSVVSVVPYVYGREVRAIAGGLYSQYFHAQKNSMGQPVVLTSDQMFVRGVGSRWPIVNGEIAPDFKTIYGKEGI